MKIYSCNCKADPFTCAFDAEDFPVCPDHSERLYGWRTTPVHDPPTDSEAGALLRAEARSALESVREVLAPIDSLRLEFV